MPCTISYTKRGQPDDGEVWSGTIADAKEAARRAVRTGKADQARVIEDGKVILHYPGILHRA